MVRAILEANEGGLMTRTYGTRTLTGRSFRKNIKLIRRENEQMAWAMEPTQSMSGEIETDEAPPADAPDDVDGDDDGDTEETEETNPDAMVT